MGSFRCSMLLVMVACGWFPEHGTTAFSTSVRRSPMSGVTSLSMRDMVSSESSSLGLGRLFNISSPGPSVDDSIVDDDENDLVVSSKMELAPASELLGDGEPDTEKIGMWTARLLLLLIAVIWGTNFASVKYLETLCFNPPCNHLPSEAALARFGVATAVSLPLLVGQRKDIILGGLECGAWISLGYITQAVALASIPSGKCAFICSLTVVVVPLISALFYDKKITPLNLISAAVALSGVAILEGLVDTTSVAHFLDGGAGAAVETASKAIATSASAANTNFLQRLTNGELGIGLGDVIALGQPFGFGLAFLRIEHYVEKFKEEKNQVLTLSAAQCLAVGGISLLWVLYDFHGTIPDLHYLMEPHRLAAVAWTGIVTTVLAIYFEGVALQTASATDAALTFSSEPVWASLFGVWLLHEQLNLNAYVGGAIILVGCILGVASDLPEFQDGEEGSTSS